MKTTTIALTVFNVILCTCFVILAFVTGENARLAALYDRWILRKK